MTTPLLSESLIETILAALPTLTIGVLGDLFLDRYLDIDPGLTEKSIETGLDAFQVVRVRSYPGAAGTVLNNLAALGVGRVVPLTVIGDDGEGYELLQALRQVPCVDTSRIISTQTRRTPTYTKPMFHEPTKEPREGHRLDIRNRQPMAEQFQAAVCQHLSEVWPALNGLVVLDQVNEAECGVVTERVRQLLATLGQAHPARFILADSRDQIARFFRRQSQTKPVRVLACRAGPGRHGG